MASRDYRGLSALAWIFESFDSIQSNNCARGNYCKCISCSTRVSSIQWEGMRCEFNSAHLNIFMAKFYVCDWKTHFMINGTSISDVKRAGEKRQTTIRSRWLLNRFMNVIFLWRFRPKFNLSFILFSFLTHLFPRHDMACGLKCIDV